MTKFKGERQRSWRERKRKVSTKREVTDTGEKGNRDIKWKRESRYVHRRGTGVLLLLSIYFRCIDCPLKGMPSSICDCESPPRSFYELSIPPPVDRRCDYLHPLASRIVSKIFDRFTTRRN